MRIAGIIKNDFTAFGVCTTLFVQGCPIHCPGCHNPESWDFRGGIEKDLIALLSELLTSLKDNNISRDLCVQGGEPLCEENAYYVHFIISHIKEVLPNIRIYIWSGYTYEQLKSSPNEYIQEILNMVDILVAGPYKEAERDVTLHLCGSRNQEVIYLTREK